MHAAPPLDDLSEWDAAAEITYEFEQPATILTAFIAAPREVRADLDDFQLDPGRYRIRAYARQSGTSSIAKTEDDLVDDWDYDPDNPDYDMFLHPEDICLHFWVTECRDPNPIVLKDDRAYHHVI